MFFSSNRRWIIAIRHIFTNFVHFWKSKIFGNFSRQIEANNSNPQHITNFLHFFKSDFSFYFSSRSILSHFHEFNSFFQIWNFSKFFSSNRKWICQIVVNCRIFANFLYFCKFSFFSSNRKVIKRNTFTIFFIFSNLKLL